MKKALVYSFVACGLLAMTGCNSKMGQFASEYFSTNPNPLEVVGQEVPATVTANIPAKFFKKNAEVTVTPVLVYGTTEDAATPVTLQGEKVRGNAPVISYDNGGTVTIPVSYLYNPEMLKSELYLTFNVTQGKKQYALPRVKVADGVIATAALANAGAVNPATAADAFQRIINEKYSADIRFLINQAKIRKEQLESEEMGALNEKILSTQGNDRLDLKEVNIQSYASPEGTVEFNTELAEKREKNNVIDFMKYPKRVYPIGRLDKDSEGLLLMTNNGELVNKIMRAGNNHEKEYIVTVNKPVTDSFIRGLAGGVPLVDLNTTTRKCKVEKIANRKFRIILTQGLNRQIRRMCEYFGYRVEKLERVRIMNITLGDLKLGQYREVTPEEYAKLMKLTKESSSAPIDYKKRESQRKEKTHKIYTVGIKK